MTKRQWEIIQVALSSDWLGWEFKFTDSREPTQEELDDIVELLDPHGEFDDASDG